MKNKRVNNVWSKHNLPLDLWPEILSRLPVKSLLRFRCVSKSWRLWIDDPDFCRLHLSRFKNNSKETHLLFVQGSISYCFIRCSETFRTLRRFSLGSWDRTSRTYRTTAELGYTGIWYPMYSIDGLVLLRRIPVTQQTVQQTEFVLWNPSLRKSRLLPSSPEVVFADKKRNINLGLGFDHLMNDYKFVRVVLRDRSVHWIAIYTVGACSWKTIQFQGKGCSDWRWYPYEPRTVCFRGSLYFTAKNRDSHTTELVSFDLSSEVFSFTSLPAPDWKLHNELILIDGGCSLAVFHYSMTQGSIWVMDSSNTDVTSMSWTKYYTFTCDMTIPKFLFVKKNGDMLVGWKEDTLYNVQTQEEKLLPKSCCKKEIRKIFGYIESLVLLK